MIQPITTICQRLDCYGLFARWARLKTYFPTHARTALAAQTVDRWYFNIKQTFMVFACNNIPQAPVSSENDNNSR
jgi:hypothetical protein